MKLKAGNFYYSPSHEQHYFAKPTEFGFEIQDINGWNFGLKTDDLQKEKPRLLLKELKDRTSRRLKDCLIEEFTKDL